MTSSSQKINDGTSTIGLGGTILNALNKIDGNFSNHDVAINTIQTSVAGVQGKWQPGQSYIGLVGTRGKSPTNGGTGFTQHMARTVSVAKTNITQIGAAFANWYVTTSGEFAIGGDATITASVEYPLGTTVTRLTFNGQNSGTAYDYSTLASDLISINIPAGAEFAIREFRHYTGSGSIPFTNQVGLDITDGDCYNYGSSGVTDLTGSAGTFAGGDGSSHCNPVAIFGPTSLPSYALIGDSRGEGYGDNGNGNLYIGWMERSVGPVRAFTNLSKFGEYTSTAATLGFRQRAAIINKYCTHILCEYGVNDLFAGGQTVDQVLKSIDQIQEQFPYKWFYQTTLMGETNSTDAWTTLINQATVDSNKDESRRWFNNYVRSGMHRFDGVYDVSTVVESSFNSGLWKVPGYTADGLHPTPLGYATIASSGVIKVQ